MAHCQPHQKQNHHGSFNFPQLSIPLCVTLTSIAAFLSLKKTKKKNKKLQ
jgi:hypothetical protein